LLRLVSFPIGVTSEGAKRTLGLIAGGNLRVVGKMTFFRAVQTGSITSYT
jgi:hypothetical protein